MTTEPTELEQMVDDALSAAVPDEVHDYIEPGEYDVEPVEPAWQIDGERTADWCARRVLRAEARIAAAKTAADELRAQADEYLARVKAREERSIAFFMGRLHAWHDGILAAEPRSKTIELPSARLEQRAGGVSLEVEDEAAAVAWLQDHDDDLLEYADPRVKKNDVKKKYGAKVADDPGRYPCVDTETGELVPGVTIVRGVPSEKLRPAVPEGGDQ